MLAGLVLCVLVLAAAAATRLGRAGAVLLAAVCVLWLLVNRSMEGPTLVTVSHSHGLTAADLAGLTGIGVAGWVWLRTR